MWTIQVKAIEQHFRAVLGGPRTASDIGTFKIT